MPGVVINAYLLRGLQDGSLIPLSLTQQALFSLLLIVLLDYSLAPRGRRAMPCWPTRPQQPCLIGIPACCLASAYWFAPVSSMLLVLFAVLPASSSDRPACKHWPPPMV
jgi:CHASE2 domain-containing sensor protein